MFKSIIKEVFIILLLILAILLILCVMFYDYRPNTKKIPSVVAEYALPEEMAIELNETINASETQNIVKTYQIDSDDLRRYANSNDYDQGKINPFAKMSSGSGDSTNNSQGNGQTGNQGSFLNTVK